MADTTRKTSNNNNNKDNVFDDELTLQQLEELDLLQEEKEETPPPPPTVSASSAILVPSKPHDEIIMESSLKSTNTLQEENKTMKTNNASSSSSSSSLPTTTTTNPPPRRHRQSVVKTVTTDRKNELLSQARTDRLEWIQSTPLPYHHDATLYSCPTRNKHTMQEQQEQQEQYLQKLQYSHVGMELPSAIPILKYLKEQSAPSSSFITMQNNNHDKDNKKDTSSLVPSMEDMKLALPTGLQLLQSEISMLEQQQQQQEQEQRQSNHDETKRLYDILIHYQSFLETLVQPECTMLVQGMRNFVRKFHQYYDFQNVNNDATTTTTTALANTLKPYVDKTYESLKSHPAWSTKRHTTTTTTTMNDNNGPNTTSIDTVQPPTTTTTTITSMTAMEPHGTGTTTTTTMTPSPPLIVMDQNVRRSLESFIYGHLYQVIWNTLQKESMTLDHDEHEEQDDTKKDKDAPSSLQNKDMTTTTTTTTLTMEQMELKWMDRLGSLQFVTPHHLEIKCLTSFLDNYDTNNNHKNKNNNNNDNDSGNGNVHDENENDDDDKDDNHDFQRLDDLLKTPIELLRTIHTYYSPYEKLQQILAVYHSANEALTKALNHAANSNNNKKLPSADDILPTLIFIVLRSKPTQLWMNLRYIEQFAIPEYLRGEAGYAYTNLYSAVQFIQDLNLVVRPDGDGDNSGGGGGAFHTGTSLNISKQELQKGLQKCRETNAKKKKEAAQLIMMKDKTMMTNNSTNVTTDHYLEKNSIDRNHHLQVSHVRQARLKGETLDLDWALRQQQTQEATTLEEDFFSSSPRSKTSHQVHGDQGGSDQDNITTTTTTMSASALAMAADDNEYTSNTLPPGFTRTYSFLNTRPEDLRVTDLSQLLKEYKMLVHTTEILLGERSTRLATERKERLRKTQQELEAHAASVNLLEENE